MKTAEDKANLFYIKSETVKQSYIRGAELNGFLYGKRGDNIPTNYPTGTLIGDAYRKGYKLGQKEFKKRIKCIK